MLIEFSVGNYRSFREPVTLSMEAAAIVSEDKAVDENNLIPLAKNLTLLTSAAVYGANASGKSNLISALSFMRRFILDSARETQADESIKAQPFRLDQSLESKPSFFEMILLIDGQKYRYGFEVTPERVEREWLYSTPTIREGNLFLREGDEIRVNPRTFREGRGLEKRTRSNALFLSVVGQFNGLVASSILRWFRQVGFVSGLDDQGYKSFTLRLFNENPEFRQNILNLVRSLDLGLETIRVKKENRMLHHPEGLADDLKEAMIQATGMLYSTQSEHVQYNSIGEPVGKVTFEFEADESQGTQKLFYLAGPVLHTLLHGTILVIDEMEARMHPQITCALIRLFNSRETNPKRAQIIFTTHDTNLLDRSLFRRDQVWFTEKDSYGASHLYSLVDFKPRNDEVYERNYLRGKYGAVPALGDLQRVIAEEHKTYRAGSDAA